MAYYASLGPEAQEEILIDRLQCTTCPDCGQDFRTEPAFTYLDPEAGLWIAARPAEALADWQQEEAGALAAFEEIYGAGAPKDVQEIGADLASRLTFGWPALREKLMIAEHSLSDVAIELTKLAILRNRPGNPIAEGVELRLLDVRGPNLEFGWLTRRGGKQLDVFEAQRRLYESILKDPAWQEAATRLPERGLVDLQRLFIAPAGPT